MTEPLKFRRRRRGGQAHVSDDLAAWFAREASSPPWEVLLPEEELLLPARWRAWSEGRPGARPPVGYEWIALPEGRPAA